MSAQHTPGPWAHKVVIGGKTYKAHLDGSGVVTRISYVNSVRGECALDMTGRIARSVLAVVAEDRKLATGPNIRETMRKAVANRAAIAKATGGAA